MYRAIVVERHSDSDTPNRARLVDRDEPDRAHGDVSIAVEYSSVNYKDALALTGRPGVVRRTPLIAGIDLVGTVEYADGAAAERFDSGDRVVLNGAGLGERHDGGLAERARVDSASLLRLPGAISADRAGAIGTAGFTAMLAVLALERHGLRAGEGPVLVTGASGGVGSLAVALLTRLGHEVVASTGRVDEHGTLLRQMGAAAVIDRAELHGGGKPLQTERWAGVVDSAGSHTLANALAQTRWGGTVAACGLAQGPDLPASVMPFILRGVTLAGINSVEAPRKLREEAWRRLAHDLDLALLDELTTTVPLAEAFGAADSLLAGRSHGRILVDVRA
ncbi:MULTISPECIES: MDR family oxidoreductase [unclassified Rathayibacter]|uniref:MDR family oxidoreductase n=1 Tax=unclassified Rathayibacter TaxID=2609250 RepID=UPI00188BA965|nr:MULTISPECIES: MDR family oxidoreductase [unclassified Rathayibacter]MBF4461436.1 oxidoreductase [Rathayibacter sp. VKM Ac-2879]MBF4502847.1 oxidoreductase [Rathayibacter sp. VKM Ac-2878]